ncbi:unnamed protein product [Caretta caretta]
MKVGLNLICIPHSSSSAVAYVYGRPLFTRKRKTASAKTTVSTTSWIEDPTEAQNIPGLLIDFVNNPFHLIQFLAKGVSYSDHLNSSLRCCENQFICAEGYHSEDSLTSSWPRGWDTGSS